MSEPRTASVTELDRTIADSDRPRAAGDAVPENLPKLNIPAKVGPYSIHRLLGRGGMGAVYEATHDRLQKRVALKVMPQSQIYDPNARARFSREARAVGKLDHPNVVRATDAGDVDGVPYLAMELVEGIDLASMVRTLGPMAVNDVVEVVRQAAEGLSHAHQRGVIHRDIKPSNLMLAADGAVKILDLGLALCLEAATGRSDSPLTTNAYLGTHDYMAPEQWNDPSLVNSKADIYGLGCAAYYLLTGSPPFHDHRNAMGKMKAHTEQPAPSLMGRNEIPLGLASLIGRTLSKNPNDRPTCAQVIEELAAYAGPNHLAKLVEQARSQSLATYADGSTTNLQQTRIRSEIVHAPTATYHDPAYAGPAVQSGPRYVSAVLWMLAVVMLAVSLVVGAIVFFQLKPTQ